MIFFNLLSIQTYKEQEKNGVVEYGIVHVVYIYKKRVYSTSIIISYFLYCLTIITIASTTNITNNYKY